MARAHLEIHEYVSKKSPGDRSRNLVCCSLFQVLLMDEHKAVVLNTFDQYIEFWNSIGSRSDVEEEARKYCMSLSPFFPDVVNRRKFIPKPPPPAVDPEWEEVEPTNKT